MNQFHPFSIEMGGYPVQTSCLLCSSSILALPSARSRRLRFAASPAMAQRATRRARGAALLRKEPRRARGLVFTVLWVDSLGASKQTYCTFTTTCYPTGPTVQSVAHFLDHTARRPSSPCDFSPLRDRIQSTGAKRGRPTKYWLQETETKLLTFFLRLPLAKQDLPTHKKPLTRDHILGQL